MSERLKGSEDIRQPEVIQLDQEFFPLRNIFISVDTFRGYNISEKYYELPIPGNHLSINVESQIGGFEHQNPLAIRPFGEGYRIDQEDFDLKTRKAKITDIVRSSKAKSDLDNLWLCVYINSCYAKPYCSSVGMYQTVRPEVENFSMRAIALTRRINCVS